MDGRRGVLIRGFLSLTVALAAMAPAAPARAWWFADDGTSWPVFDFHRYGGDVNRPAATPDRPYFHGDDAVPLGLRWRDLEEARAEAAAADAAAAAVVRVEAAPVVPARPAVRRPVRRRHVAHRPPPICVPGPAATKR